MSDVERMPNGEGLPPWVFLCPRCKGRAFFKPQPSKVDAWPERCSLCEGRGTLTRYRLGVLLGDMAAPYALAEFHPVSERVRGPGRYCIGAARAARFLDALSRLAPEVIS